MLNRIPPPARILLVAIGLLILAVVVYNIPFVNEKLSPRVEDLRTQLVYFFRPPDQAVFQPGSQRPALGTGTLPAPQVRVVTHTPEGTATLSGPTPTPTITSTPPPASISLPGVKYVNQKERWNYCGPANLTMALNFWGWKGNRDDVAKVVKPGVNDPKLNFIDKGKPDKNVMPYELVDFVNDNTEYHALSRFGGEMDVLKGLIAAGYPVMVEKGYYEKDYTGKISWLGHYQFVTGYDNVEGAFIVQDTWNDGPNFHIAYDKFLDGWRGFNYIFMVVYPADRENQVLSLLGNWSDNKWANQHALEIANQEVKTTTGINAFFAWFNKGTSHIQLLEYNDAAPAFDQAFSIYNTLGADDKQRPYRIMWYQTWPYWAYYYTGRYQDVIDLADTTLNKTIAEPTLEESLYWRGLAELALGQTGNGVKDIQLAVYYNPNFAPGVAKLKELGAPLNP